MVINIIKWLKKAFFKKVTWWIGSKRMYHFNIISTVYSDQQLERASQEMHINYPIKLLDID